MAKRAREAREAEAAWAEELARREARKRIQEAIQKEEDEFWDRFFRTYEALCAARDAQPVPHEALSADNVQTIDEFLSEWQTGALGEALHDYGGES